MKIPTEEEIKATIQTAEALIPMLQNPADKEYLDTVISALEWTVGKADSPLTDYV
jgi:hypothetical protein